MPPSSKFKILGKEQKRIRDIVFEGFEPRDGPGSEGQGARSRKNNIP